MRVIRPNCRQRFTGSDFQFLGHAAFPQGEPESFWRYLVGDPSHLDELLDGDKLYRAILDLGQCVDISLPFYFYVLTRHTLLRHGIDDRELADYVAALLADFALHPRMHQPVEGEPAKDYYFELLQAVNDSQGEKRFLLTVHIGNRALFETGMLHHAVEERERRRAAPGIEFLEELGSGFFKEAARQSLADHFGLVTLFLTLGQAFHLTRLALNQISDDVVCLRESPAVSQLLKSVQSDNR